MNRKRTSKSQLNIYIDYLEKYPILVNGKFSPANSLMDITQIWESMVNKMNACGDGPVRTVVEWKKVIPI